MDPAAAAALLGVPLTADRESIEVAFQRRAWSARSEADIARLGEALRVMRVVRPRVWPLLLTWATLALLASAVSVLGAIEWPLTLAEPVSRYAVLIAALTTYAATGSRVVLGVAIVAIAATLVMTVVFASFGLLLGTLLLVVPVGGLLVLGRRTARFRALVARETR